MRQAEMVLVEMKRFSPAIGQVLAGDMNADVTEGAVRLLL